MSLTRWKTTAIALSLGLGALGVIAGQPNDTLNKPTTGTPIPVPQTIEPPQIAQVPVFTGSKPITVPAAPDTLPPLAPGKTPNNVEEFDIVVPAISSTSPIQPVSGTSKPVPIPALDTPPPPTGKPLPVIETIAPSPVPTIPAPPADLVPPVGVKPVLHPENKPTPKPEKGPATVPSIPVVPPVAIDTPPPPLNNVDAVPPPTTIKLTPPITPPMPPEVAPRVLTPQPIPSVTTTIPAEDRSRNSATSNSSKLKMLLRVGVGTPRFEIRNSTGEELLLKVYAEKIEMQSATEGPKNSPLAGVTALGKVRFTGPGMEGTCDQLTILSGTGEVLLKGNIHMKTRRSSKSWSEMTAEKMIYQIGSSGLVTPSSSRIPVTPASFIPD